MWGCRACHRKARFSPCLLRRRNDRFVSGGNEILTISQDDGIDVQISETASFGSGRAITFSDSSGDEVGGLYSNYFGSDIFFRMGTGDAGGGAPPIGNVDSWIIVES